MRRSDREVKDRQGIIEIIEQCDICRIALNDPSGFPYILPLNYGIKVENDGKDVTLYFHGALEGRKYELIDADNRASFEMECETETKSYIERGYCTEMYKSVIGRGYIHMVEDPDEIVEGLDRLCEHYHIGGFPYSKKAIPRTKVFKLVIEEMTGKIKK